MEGFSSLKRPPLCQEEKTAGATHGTRSTRRSRPMTRARITAQRAYISQRWDAARLDNARSLLSIWFHGVGSNVQDSDPVRVY